MLRTLGSLLVSALCAGIVLYLLWQLVERLDYYMIGRRRAKVNKEAGGYNICRWGINAAGDVCRVSTHRPPKA